MKKNILLPLAAILISGITSATTLNGRFVLSNQCEGKEFISDSLYIIKIQVNTNTGLDDLGGATVVLSFDTTQLSFSSSPAAGRDFISPDIRNENYSQVKITRVFDNQLWLNIVLNINDKGAVVKGVNGWTDLVTLYFRKQTSLVNNPVKWETESHFWAVYDGNNSDIWSVGNFDNIPKVEENTIAPSDFNLNQNFPNPFNPETTINFSLKNSGSVRLVILNVLGEEVKILVNDRLEQGYHSVKFNGSGLSSGIYIYRLDADNVFSAVKKMVLLK